VLGGLQLRAIGRLVHQPDAIGHGEVLWPVPARIVELQDDARGMINDFPLCAAQRAEARSASISPGHQGRSYTEGTFSSGRRG
jgi:hypothetical protein